MSNSWCWLAFDLGAESGRALLGRYAGGNLTMEEIHRFPNEPVEYNSELHWDVARLWHELQKALAVVGARGIHLEGIGVDAWGVDYALLGERDALLGNPFHYRDKRTDGMMERVFALVSPDEIYTHTGIQFMQINGLYQLYAQQVRTPTILLAARTLITIPDLFNFWLTGIAAAEFTNATTTQLYDPRKGAWSTELLDKLGIPAHFLPPVVPPGTILGTLRPEVASKAGIGTVPVIVPACHDTGSAVAAIAGASDSVYISSGTWSLVGTEVHQPVINKAAQLLNFTNEGGVCGTYRFLKNVMGLWLLQGCRRDWELAGQSYTYAELMQMVSSGSPFACLVNPDHPSFLHPQSMLEALEHFFRSTGQREPQSAAAVTRAVLESLALKYRLVLDNLETLTGRQFKEIHIVGGGARNELLNQFTAEATGRRVVAGPVEATALGNIGMQMLASRAVGSLQEVRELIAHSFPVTVYEPRQADDWEQVYTRFKTYCDAMP
jgi:rhamnulokinase